MWVRGLRPDIRHTFGDGWIRLDKAVELVAMVLPATTVQRRLEGLGRRQVTATVLPVAPESRSEASEGRRREDGPKTTALPCTSYLVKFNTLIDLGAYFSDTYQCV